MLGRLGVVLVTLVLLAANAPARAQAPATLEVQLRNGTAGGPVPTEARVFLLAFRGGARVAEREGKVDPSGTVRFENLDPAPDLTYALGVQYRGVPYVHPAALSFKEGPPPPLQLTVYETTTDPAALRFERANVLVLADPLDAVEVLEMGVVTNAGDRTVVASSERPYTLRYGLPRGATELTPQRGFSAADLVSLPDGFGVARPIVPGRTEYALAYRLPRSGDSAPLGRTLYHPVETFSAYVPDRGQGGPQLASPQLAPRGRTELGGAPYLVYGAEQLPAGSQLVITASGLATDIRRVGADPAVYLGLGVFAALLGGALLLARRRAGAPAPPAAAGPTDGEPPRDERLALLLRLADLDDRYAAGAIPEEEYRAARSREKARLKALLRRTG